MNLDSPASRRTRRRDGPADRQIGRRIRTYRLAQKISQAELGRRIGVSFQQIQKYEKGANSVRGSRIRKIAAALDVSVTALLGGPEAPREKRLDAVVTEMMTQRYSLRLLHAFCSIPTKREQRAVVALLEAMVSESRAAKRRRPRLR